MASFHFQKGIQGELFSDKAVRHGFIRKVYSLLSVQLVITFGIMMIWNLNEEAKQYAMTHKWIGLVIVLCSLIPLCSLACCQSVARMFPINLILLAVFAILQGCALGFIGASIQTVVILIAVGITGIVVIGLTIFAFQTRIDFTVFTGGMLALLLTLLAIGIIAAIVRVHWLSMLYAALGTLVFSIYIIIDTQLIMGGKTVEISPEEYVLAVLHLYIDIIQLFFMVLNLTNGST